jgi:diaminohydroxyphosphoribosylaminopyrimidine deaminase/5-amino-6-(5-phosphoribosylamino)uracil reductase
MKDPNPDVIGGGIGYLKDQGVDVTLGVCEDAAKKLNEAYIKYITTKRPFVIVKCAATLDGRIATRTGDSRWVTGEESKNLFTGSVMPPMRSWSVSIPSRGTILV